MDHLEKVSEFLIKVENVKQELADGVEEEACNFMEGVRTCPLKVEAKEENEEIKQELGDGAEEEACKFMDTRESEEDETT